MLLASQAPLWRRDQLYKNHQGGEGRDFFVLRAHSRYPCTITDFFHFHYPYNSAEMALISCCQEIQGKTPSKPSTPSKMNDLLVIPPKPKKKKKTKKKKKKEPPKQKKAKRGDSD